MADLERWLVELRAAEAVLAQERMEPRAARRVARRIAQDRHARAHWWRPYVPAVYFAAGAALVLLVLALQQRGRMLVGTPAPATQSELDAQGTSCEGDAIEATCETQAPPALRLPPAVPPLPAAPPATVAPTLQRPRAAMRPTDAARGVRSTDAAIAVPEPPLVEPTSQPAEDPVAALLRELRALRRAGRYVEAARKLERALAEPWPARTREILHYELGTIRERHLEDRPLACETWREHLQRFPKTRYAAAIADARRRLGCE